MPRYDYKCSKCDVVFEVEKSMSASAPSKCPACGKKEVERVFLPDGSPSVVYTNRPPWTYAEAKKYKTARWNGGPLVKIDPSKHGDIGSWNCPGEVVPENKKKGKR